MAQEFIVLERKSRALSLVPLTLAIVFGLLVTVGLAWFMSSLISSDEISLISDSRSLVLDFIRINRAEVSQRRERELQRPKTIAAPNLPVTPTSVAMTGPEPALSVELPSVEVGSLLPGQTFLTTGSSEGDYLPIVKVAPVYPMRAVTLGIYGECMVRYDVTSTGATRNVEVVADHCADPIFERPSIEAAKRFKYKPRVIGGAAVEVLGVRNVFHFTQQSSQ